jgi:hypothetical protein
MVSFDRDDFVLDSLAQVDFPLLPRNPVLLGGSVAGSRPVRSRRSAAERTIWQRNNRSSKLFRSNFRRRITLSFALLLMENLLCSEWIQEPPLAPSMSVVIGTTASIQFPAPPSYRRN